MKNLIKLFIIILIFIISLQKTYSQVGMGPSGPPKCGSSGCFKFMRLSTIVGGFYDFRGTWTYAGFCFFSNENECVAAIAQWVSHSSPAPGGGKWKYKIDQDYGAICSCEKKEKTGASATSETPSVTDDKQNETSTINNSSTLNEKTLVDECAGRDQNKQAINNFIKTQGGVNSPLSRLGFILKNNIDDIPCGYVISSIYNTNNEYNLVIDKVANSKQKSPSEEEQDRKKLDSFYDKVKKKYALLENTNVLLLQLIKLLEENNSDNIVLENIDGSSLLVIDSDQNGSYDTEVTISGEGETLYGSFDESFLQSIKDADHSKEIGPTNKVEETWQISEKEIYPKIRAAIDNTIEVFETSTKIEQFAFPHNPNSSETASLFLSSMNTSVSGVVALKNGDEKATMDFFSDGIEYINSFARKAGGALTTSMGAFSSFMISLNVIPDTYDAVFGKNGEIANVLAGKEPDPSGPLGPLMNDLGNKMYLPAVQKFKWFWEE